MDPLAELKQTFFQECEELLGALEQKLQALDEGSTDPEDVNAAFRADPAHRARTILIGLDVNLDHDAGGDVAVALSRVYRSMRRKLDDAVADNSAEALDELLNGIVTISSAWRQIR